MFSIVIVTGQGSVPTSEHRTSSLVSATEDEECK